MMFETSVDSLPTNLPPKPQRGERRVASSGRENAPRLDLGLALGAAVMQLPANRSAYLARSCPMALSQFSMRRIDRALAPRLLT